MSDIRVPGTQPVITPPEVTSPLPETQGTEVKMIEDYAFQDRKALSTMLQTMDPQNTKEKLEITKVIADSTGMEYQYIINNFDDVFEKYSGQKPGVNPMSIFLDTAQVTAKSFVLDKLIYERDHGGVADTGLLNEFLYNKDGRIDQSVTPEQAQDMAIEKLQAEITQLNKTGRRTGGEKFSENLSSTGSSMLYFIAQTLNDSAENGTMFIPGAVGAKATTNLGKMLNFLKSGDVLKAGSRLSSGIQINSLAEYRQMREMGIDKENATKMAWVSGSIVGALDSLSLGIGEKAIFGNFAQQAARRVITSGAAAKMALGTAAVATAAEWASETGTESLQEFVSAIFQNMTVEMSAKAQNDPTLLKQLQTWEDIQKRVGDVAISMAQGMAVLAPLGGVVSGKRAFQDLKRINLPIKEWTKKAEDITTARELSTVEVKPLEAMETVETPDISKPQGFLVVDPGMNTGNLDLESYNGNGVKILASQEEALELSRKNSTAPLNGPQFIKSVKESSLPGWTANLMEDVIKKGPEAVKNYQEQIATLESDFKDFDIDELVDVADSIRTSTNLDDRNQILNKYNLQKALPPGGIRTIQINAENTKTVEREADIRPAFDAGAEAVQYDGDWYIKDAKKAQVIAEQKTDSPQVVKNVGDYTIKKDGDTYRAVAADGTEIGSLTVDSEMQFKDTLVPPEYRRQGIGQALVRRAVEDNPGIRAKWGKMNTPEARAFRDSIRRKSQGYQAYGPRLENTELEMDYSKTQATKLRELGTEESLATAEEWESKLPLLEARKAYFEERLDTLKEQAEQDPAKLTPEEYREQVEGNDLTREQMQRVLEKQLSTEEAEVALAIMDKFAQYLGKSTNEFLQDSLNGIRLVNGIKSGLNQYANGITIGSTAGKRIVELSKKANVTTVLHEMFHVMRPLLSKPDTAMLASAVGQDPAAEAWTVEAEEKAARMFERYLQDGKAPSADLQTIFDKLAIWFKWLYEAVGQFLGTVTPEAKQVFDNLLTKADQVSIAQNPDGSIQETPMGLFQYVGEGSNLSEAEINRLNKAKKMNSENIDLGEIRKKTGWFLGKYDSKWRMEISDQHFAVLEHKLDEPRPLSEVVIFPGLFEKYPDAKNIIVAKTSDFFTDDKDMAGSMAKGSDGNDYLLINQKNIENTWELKRTFVHELQHWIQGVEGFPGGSNRESLKERRKELDKKIGILGAAISLKKEVQNGKSMDEAITEYEDVMIHSIEYESIDQANNRTIEDLTTEADNLWKERQKLLDLNLAYVNTAGEIESRAIETRLGYSSAQRFAIYPYSGEFFTKQEDAVILYQEDLEPGFMNQAKLFQDEWQNIEPDGEVQTELIAKAESMNAAYEEYKGNAKDLWKNLTEREKSHLSQTTWIPGKRSWEDAKEAGLPSIVVALDADGLKFVNDDMGGHEAGDQLLAYIGKAMAKATADMDVTPYHVSGDEFYLTSESNEQIELALAKVNKLLSKAIIGRKIEHGFQIILEGPELSFGKVRDGNYERADKKTGNDKARKLVEGRRAEREDVPFNARILGPDGRLYGKEKSREIINARREQRKLDASKIDHSDLDNPQALEARIKNLQNNLSDDTLFQEAGDIESPEFKTWFGDSKVVDGQGKPLVVYHGTDKKFQEFKERKDNGFWFTPDEKSAYSYAEKRTSERDKRQVYRVYVRIENPSNSQYVSLSKPDSKQWEDDTVPFYEAGYDGWISRNDDGSIFTVVVKDPTQIKSVNNTGAWNPNDPRILYQEDPDYREQVRTIKDSEKLVKEFRESMDEKVRVLSTGKGPEYREAMRKQMEATLEAMERDLEAGREALSQAIQKAREITEAQGESYDPHQAFTRQAVEAGRVVPMESLIAYRDQEWAETELSRREMFKDLIEEARGFKDMESWLEEIESYETFADEPKSEKVNKEADGDKMKATELYTKIYIASQIKTAAQADKEFKESLDEKKVEQILLAIGRNIEADSEKKLPRHVRSQALKIQNNEVNKAELPRILKTMQNDPRTYRRIYWAYGDFGRDEGLLNMLSLEKDEETFMEAAELEDVKIQPITAPDDLELELRTRIILGDKDRAWWTQRARGLEKEVAQLETDLEAMEKSGNAQVREALQAGREARNSAAQEVSLTMKGNLEAERDMWKSAIEETKLTIKIKLAELKATRKMRDYHAKLAKQIMAPVGKTVLVDYRVQIQTMQELLDPANRTQKTETRKAQLQAWLDKNPEVKARMKKKDRIETYGKSLNLWTTAELEDLRDNIQTLKDTGRAELKAQTAKWDAEVENYKSAVLDALYRKVADLYDEQAKEKDPTRRQELAEKILEWEARKSDINEATAKRFEKGDLDSNLLTISNLADKMDGGLGTYKGPNHELIYTLPKKAENEKLAMVQRRMESMFAWMKDSNLTTEELGNKITFDGLFDSEKVYTVNELLTVYVGLKNEKKKAALVHGNRIDIAVQKYVSESAAFGKYRNLGDKIIQDYGQNKDRLDQAFHDYQNDILGSEENYTPMIRQSVSYESMDEQLSWEKGQAFGANKASVDKGFSKDRITISDAHQTPIKLGEFSLWLQQVGRQEQYIAMAPVVKRLNQVYGSKEINAAIQETFGNGYAREIKEYTNLLANPYGSRTYNWLESLSAKARGNAAVAYMSWNPLTVLKQTPALAQYLPYTDPGSLLSAIGEFISSKGKLWDETNEKSQQVKNRTVYKEIEDMEAGRLEGSEKVLKKVARAGMKGIPTMDKLIVIVGWNSVYRKAQANGMTETAARDYADFITNKTQATTSVIDSSGLFRKPSEFTRGLTMFAGPTNKIANELFYGIGSALKGKRTWDAAALGGAYILGAVAIWMISKGRVPDEPEEYLEALAQQTTDLVPVVGTIISAEWRGWGDSTPTLAKPIKDITGTVIDISRAIEHQKNGDLEKAGKSLENGIISALDTAGLAFGVPTTEPKRIYRAIKTGNGWELMGWRAEED